ncbi:helix-turn-helix domain-containing protein [uncultured Ruegeria sp.]|uniref:helix-turn-helix domain-containing protein n=1 Tax=uncultured Ruegeria sp. TaxID=259304 RepID=UPI00344C429F
MAPTFHEREEISRGLVAKQSLKSIARSLHRAPSTISRKQRWPQAQSQSLPIAARGSTGTWREASGLWFRFALDQFSFCLAQECAQRETQKTHSLSSVLRFSCACMFWSMEGL